MNKAIASILKDQLTGTPLIEKLAGMVQTAEYPDVIYDENGENPKRIIQRLPISTDAETVDCTDKTLVPDGYKTGILYFEDNGVSVLGKQGTYYKYRSRLRLVAWLNTITITNAKAASIAAPVLISHITSKLDSLTNSNVNPFLRLHVSVDAIPRQSRAIFSEYTYDLYNTQYILPPYEFFAMDLSVDFMMHPSCIDELVLNPALSNCQ